MIQRLKTGRRWCSLFLSLCLMYTFFVTVPVEAAETQISGDWKYVILEDGTVEIAGYTGNETRVVIPGMIDRKSVTSIGFYAFYNCRSITSIDIPSSVTSIGAGVFDDCSSLTSINIPSSVTGIGRSAFGGCSSLTSIDIPSNVTSIGDYAFRGCSSLTSINVAENSKNYASKDGILYSKSCKSLICCPGGKQGIITIPSSVTSIGSCAFWGCSRITSIDIPSSVTSIEARVFSGCSSLTSINVAENSQNHASKDGILYNKSYKSLICCPEGKQGTITIPSNVTSIGESAFSGCSSLTSIDIPSSVTSIGESAFSGCSSLTSIGIPSSVTSIGDYVFSGCRSLTNIDIPSSVTSIGKDAFSNCSSLTNIDIPSSVTSIGRHAFWRCSSLTSIDIPSSVTSIGDYAFSGCSSDLTIYAEPGSYAEEYGKENGIEFKCLHTPMTDPAIAATCTKAGKTEGSHCSTCNEIIKPQEDIPATGHTYRQNTQKATTKKNGAIEDKCSACGDIKSTTTIYAASEIKLSKTSFTYNGKSQKPVITIKNSKGDKLSADSYKITRPKSSKKVGKYTVTVTLQGNYSGTVKLTYQITPKATSISKLTAKKKGFTVKWKKQTKQTTGYQLQYSTSKKFKGAKTVTVKKNKTISKSIKKLGAGRKYYVRIRTYKTVKIEGKNVKIYSVWSKVKSVKTKK